MLPGQPPTLIGREQDLQAVGHLLVHPHVRLLTLVGPPGVGKTSLALAAAHAMRDTLEHGVYFIDLSAIHSPDLVLPAIAQALEIREEAGHALSQLVQDFLWDRQTLLVADNFEHVLAAVPHITDLLAETYRVKFLVTSRTPLGAASERTYRVPPLALPDLAAQPSPEALSSVPSVALFAERARVARADFGLGSDNVRAVAEICVALDGLPLAIELAASRSRLLTPQALLAHLRERFALLAAPDRPARHRTLHEAIHWSYALLAPREQALFSRLGVFVGGWTLEAAEAVVGHHDTTAGIVDALGSLIDSSLVQAGDQVDGEPRFRMLESVREFALASLRARGEYDEFRRRHADHFMAVARRGGATSPGSQYGQWLNSLERDHANLRAALSWLLDTGAAEQAVVFADTLGRFWYVRGYLSEGRAWLVRALATGADAPPEALAGALHQAALLAFRSGDLTRAAALCNQSLEHSRRLGNTLGMVTSLNVLGRIAWEQGDYPRAQALHEESLQLSRGQGSKRSIAWSLVSLGLVARRQGEYERAKTLLEESLALERELDDQRGVAFALNNLGLIARYQGQFSEAAAIHEQALGMLRQHGDKYGIALLLTNLGLVCRAQGDGARARTLIEEGLSLFQHLGDWSGSAYAQYGLGLVAQDGGRYDDARQWYAKALAVRKELGDRRGVAECLEGLAGVAVADRQPDRAARLLGAAAAIRARIHAPVPPSDQPAHDRLLTAVREGLTPHVHSAAWRQGEEMAPDLAADYALGLLVDPGQRVPTPLRIRLLGGFEVHKGGSVLPSTAWRRRRDRLLLCYLLTARDPVSRDVLREALWPDLSPASAASSLHATWSHLKRALEPGLPEGAASAYLALEAGRYHVRWAVITTDVQEFEAEVELASQSSAHEEQIAHLIRAVSVYAGDLLPDEANEPWTVLERERLRGMHITVLERLAAVQAELQRDGEAVETLRSVLRIEPLREEAWRALMRILAKIGRRGEAIQVYRECEALLRDELGVAPSPETVTLSEAIASGRSL